MNVEEELDCDQAQAEIKAAFEAAAKSLGARVEVNFFTYGASAKFEVKAWTDYRKIELERWRRMVLLAALGWFFGWFCTLSSVQSNHYWWIHGAGLMFFATTYLILTWCISHAKATTVEEITRAAVTLVDGFVMNLEIETGTDTWHLGYQRR